MKKKNRIGLKQTAKPYGEQTFRQIISSYLAVTPTSNGEVELKLIDLIQKLSDH